jgi:hypothetical protein
MLEEDLGISPYSTNWKPLEVSRGLRNYRATRFPQLATYTLVRPTLTRADFFGTLEKSFGPMFHKGVSNIPSDYRIEHEVVQ